MTQFSDQNLDQNPVQEPIQTLPSEELKIENPPVYGKHAVNMKAIRKRQQLLLWGMGSFLMGGMIVYGWIVLRDDPSNERQTFKSSLATGASRVNPQEAWVYQFKNEAEIARKRLDALEDLLSRGFKIQGASKETPLKPNDPVALVQELREDLKAAQAEGTQSTTAPSNDRSEVEGKDPATDSVPPEQTFPPPPATLPEQGYLNPETMAAEKSRVGSHFRSRSVRKISLYLKNARNNVSLKTVDNTIPAGAFAKAILLGGVDASASIQASSDPRPALLRIMDVGTLPRKFHSDLMGCHVLAACYGDISSERVMMRLEKLTCTERKTGEILEVKVQGYVAGEDGRTGIRGVVVDRAGESLRNVLMGGFLSGLGEFLSQSPNPVMFSPMSGLAQTNPMGAKEMLKHGIGKGANNALDKYADFYIKRAEQLQPVIQVAAGRQVDIVFTEGISIEDSLYRQALGRSNDQERIAAVRQFRGQELGTGNQENSQPEREKGRENDD